MKWQTAAMFVDKLRYGNFLVGLDCAKPPVSALHTLWVRLTQTIRQARDISIENKRLIPLL
jgi:hypothetical protein